MDDFGKQLAALEANGITIGLRQRLIDQGALKQEAQLLQEEMEARRKKALNKEIPMEAVQEIRKRLEAVRAGIDVDVRQQLMNSLDGAARTLRVQLQEEKAALNSIVRAAQGNVEKFRHDLADTQGKVSILRDPQKSVDGITRKLEAALTVSKAVSVLHEDLVMRVKRFKHWVETGETELPQNSHLAA